MAITGVQSTANNSTNFGSLHVKWNPKKNINRETNGFLNRINSMNKRKKNPAFITVDHNKGGIDAFGGVFKVDAPHGQKKTTELQIAAFLKKKGYDVRSSLGTIAEVDKIKNATTGWMA